MNDKLQETLKKLIANADRTVTAVLGIILLGTVGLYLREQSKSEAPLDNLQRKEFVEHLPNEDYDVLVENFVNIDEDIAKDPKVKKLTEFNMFDLKSVKAQEELAKQMDAQVDEAERLIQSGNQDQALKILDSVLSRKPGHVRAIDLKKQIQGEPTATTTPVP